MPESAPAASDQVDPAGQVLVDWRPVAVRGAVALVFGVVASAWPISSAVTLVVLWGIWAAMDGIGSLAQAAAPQAPGWTRVVNIALGALALLSAVVAFTRPGLTAVTLTWALGIWLVVRGIGEAVMALSEAPQAPRALLVVTAVVDVTLGVLVAANPGRAAVGIALTMGILAIAWGLALVAAALTIRSAHRRLGVGRADSTTAVVPPQVGRSEPATPRETSGSGGAAPPV